MFRVKKKKNLSYGLMDFKEYLGSWGQCRVVVASELWHCGCGGKWVEVVRSKTSCYKINRSSDYNVYYGGLVNNKYSVAYLRVGKSKSYKFSSQEKNVTI